jgi:hypothetical protein
MFASPGPLAQVPASAPQPPQAPPQAVPVSSKRFLLMALGAFVLAVIIIIVVFAVMFKK